MKQTKKKYKICPDCKAHLRVYDFYCGNCGYVFNIPKRRGIKL